MPRKEFTSQIYHLTTKNQNGVVYYWSECGLVFHFSIYRLVFLSANFDRGYNVCHFLLSFLPFLISCSFYNSLLLCLST